MSASELDAILGTLVEREFIAERATARFAGEREYRFASELTREVAYGTLTETDRAHGHVRAGAWLEDAGEPEAAVLAEHYRRGGATSHAVEWYRRAAAEALEANDTRAVMERVDQAVTCGATGRTLGELRLLQAEVHNWQNEPEQAKRYSLEAMELMPRGSAGWADAIHHAAWADTITGDFDEVESSLDALLTCAGDAPDGLYVVALAHIATQLASGGRHEKARAVETLIQDMLPGASVDLRVIAAVTHMKSYLAFFDDALDRACDLMLETAERWRTLGNDRGWLMELANAGYAHLQLGEYARAAETLRTAADGAERASADHLVWASKINLALALAHGSRIAEARALCEDILANPGPRRQEAHVRAYMAWILLLAGATEEALGHAERGLEVAEQLVNIQPLILAVKARALLKHGSTAGAYHAASAGMMAFDSLGAMEGGEGFLRLVHAEALLAMGHEDEAHGAITAANERLISRAARIADPQRRESFLEHVPEHARTLELARSRARDSGALSWDRR